MPICNTDSFISQLQTKIDSTTGEDITWCLANPALSLSTMALKSDGTLWSWGTNSTGSLLYGTNSLFCRCSPGTVNGGGTNWCQVSVGKSHMFALKKE